MKNFKGILIIGLVALFIGVGYYFLYAQNIQTLNPQTELKTVEFTNFNNSVTLDGNQTSQVLNLINDSITLKVPFLLQENYKAEIRMMNNQNQKFSILLTPKAVAYSNRFVELDEDFEYSYYQTSDEVYEKLESLISDFQH